MFGFPKRSTSEAVSKDKHCCAWYIGSATSWRVFTRKIKCWWIECHRHGSPEDLCVIELAGMVPGIETLKNEGVSSVPDSRANACAIFGALPAVPVEG